VNYRHLYHAGNFADVFKHVVLVRLLKGLQRKDKGFLYAETHAGAGRYDLRSVEAQQTREYADGITRLWDGPALPGLEEYLASVRAQNRGSALRFYPGSPLVAAALLRPQDRMQLAELEPGECESLRAALPANARVGIVCDDGYRALKGWLPPLERRGLVLIDPPYEAGSDWERLGATLIEAVRRFPQGTYCAWYPLKVGLPVERFKSVLVDAGLRKLLVAELRLWPDDSPFRLNGSGLLVINPPWQLDDELRTLLPPLAERLQSGPTPRATVEWLVSE
jgi:23S rRNA (adenine2030-N6)-methyltransferase